MSVKHKVASMGVVVDIDGVAVSVERVAVDGADGAVVDVVVAVADVIDVVLVALVVLVVDSVSEISSFSILRFGPNSVISHLIFKQP